MSNASLSLQPAVEPISHERLGHCVRRLDPGTRALLDLSVRRRLRDDAMAPLLRTDPFHLAWRRARALERVATDLGGDPPRPLAEVRAALLELPDEVWSPLPQLMPPADERVRTLALVPREEAALAPAHDRARTRLAQFAHAAPPLRGAFKALVAATAGAALRVMLRRPPGG